jgi:hypothetical protein
MRAALISIFALGCAGAGCGASQAHGETNLQDSIQQYNDGVRWERFTVAAGMIPPRERSQFSDDMDERSHDVKITEYDIVRVVPKGSREAKVQIKMSWYKPSEGTVHETHAVQSWERQGKAWLMVEETRLRGAEMPGLAEPTSERGAAIGDRGSASERTDGMHARGNSGNAMIESPTASGSR